MYVGGGGVREQNTPAKSLLGSMTAVERGCPSPGPRGMRLMLHPSYTHIHTPSPQRLLPGLETHASAATALIRSFLLQRGTGHPILQAWDRIRGPVNSP